MGKWLVILSVSVALANTTTRAVDFENGNAPRVRIAQQRATTAGPVAAPGSNMSKPNPFPSSSGAGVSERALLQDEEYASAIQDCESLPSSQRKACVDDINKRFGQM
jgi:hypothetical protein